MQALARIKNDSNVKTAHTKVLTHKMYVKRSFQYFSISLHSILLFYSFTLSLTLNQEKSGYRRISSELLTREGVVHITSGFFFLNQGASKF